MSSDRCVRMLATIHRRVPYTERYKALIGLGTNWSVSRVIATAVCT